MFKLAGRRGLACDCSNSPLQLPLRSMGTEFSLFVVDSAHETERRQARDESKWLLIAQVVADMEGGAQSILGRLGYKHVGCPVEVDFMHEGSGSLRTSVLDAGMAAYLRRTQIDGQATPRAASDAVVGAGRRLLVAAGRALSDVIDHKFQSVPGDLGFESEEDVVPGSLTKFLPPKSCGFRVCDCAQPGFVCAWLEANA